jgi:hypothetical protein
MGRHTEVFMRHRLLRLALTLSVLALSGAALAWSGKAPFTAMVHDHEYHDVALESDGCKVRYRLYFNAPEARYAEKNGVRGYYRFKARIKLHGDKTVTSPVFGNSGAGERVYAAAYDTTSEGCWAKDAQKLAGVDVEGCRGRDCTPAPFH